jgi:hypothetical protein
LEENFLRTEYKKNSSPEILESESVINQQFCNGNNSLISNLAIFGKGWAISVANRNLKKQALFNRRVSARKPP